MTNHEIEYRMAMQAIVDVTLGEPVAYEALVRGAAGESAGAVFGRVPEAAKRQFDRACQWAAVQEFARSGQSGSLTVNVLPSSVEGYQGPLAAEFIQSALACGFPLHRLVVEISESEAVQDWMLLKETLETWQSLGILIAYDDFCAGYSGLTFLQAFRPDILKIDMAVTRGLDQDAQKRTVVQSLVALCRGMEIAIVAEGIETVGESQALAELGVRLQQGYFLQRPRVDSEQGLVFRETF